MVFIVLSISIIGIILLFRKACPRYSNHFPNGERFTRETIKRFKGKRKKNNPNDDPVGEEFGRCKFCGHQHEKPQRHSFTLNLLESSNICSCCHLTRQ